MLHLGGVKVREIGIKRLVLSGLSGLSGFSGFLGLLDLFALSGLLGLAGTAFVSNSTLIFQDAY